jgi:hypothetical protein
LKPQPTSNCKNSCDGRDDGDLTARQLTTGAHIGIGREMDSDQSDDEARAFAVPDGLPDFTIESFEDVTAEEFLRRVAYVFLFVV